MKSEYLLEIEKRLRDQGFKPTSYRNWTRISKFEIVLNFWTSSVGSGDESDIQLEAKIWLQSRLQPSSCLLAREEMRLSDELIEKKGYDWIYEVIQDLYKYAYDFLAPKVKIAAESAITGIESIA